MSALETACHAQEAALENGLVKLCWKCEQVKTRSEFSKCTAAADGLQRRCKRCDTELRAAWRAANKERNFAAGKAWREANRERRSVERKAWYKANKEQHRASCKIRYQTNRERYLAVSAAWVRANKDRKLAAGQAWRKDNPVKVRVIYHNRRARERNAEGTHTDADIQRIGGAQKWRCAMCKVGVKNGYHVDHIVSLVNGGSNWPRNLQLLCEPCNLSKNAKDPIVFARQRGLLL